MTPADELRRIIYSDDQSAYLAIELMHLKSQLMIYRVSLKVVSMLLLACGCGLAWCVRG